MVLLSSAAVMAPAHADSSSDAAISYLVRWQAESGAPGVSAAISVGEQIVFSGGVGVSDLQSGTPQNARSVHGIGSISKTDRMSVV